jgi:hypothetical protein
MINKYFDYYKSTTSKYNSIFKYMRFVFWIFVLVNILSLLISSYLLITQKIIYMIVLLVPIFLVYFIFNRKTKKVILLQYKIKADKMIWNSPYVLRQILENDKKVIKDYLDSEKLSMKKKEYILNQCKEEANRLKPKFPVFPSFVAGLFISIFNNFISWIYKQPDIITLDDALKIFIYIALYILIFLGLFMIFRTLIKQIIQEVFGRNYYEMERFKQILEEIVLDETEI